MSNPSLFLSKGPASASVLLLVLILTTLASPTLANGPICDVPSSLDFGYVVDGDSRSRWLTITNHGLETLILEPYLDSEDFILVDCPSFVEPGESEVATIRFEPQYRTGQGQSYTATLFLTYNAAWECSGVNLTGTRRGWYYDCQVETTNLDFGDVLIGQSASRTITVTNTGTSNLFLLPSSVSTAFTITGGIRSLPPGITSTFLVTFRPQDTGHVLTEAFMGDVCENVYFEGSGVRNVGPDQDLVGLYFDTGFSQDQVITDTPYTQLNAYLVMHNPSEPAGVGAWELALKLKGDSYLLNSTLEGDHVNAGTGNEFYVGLGNQPLLPDPGGDILLGTFQILVTNPYPVEVLVQLIPTPTPSIPGLMSWIPWGDADNILPLLPVTGEWTVGWINAPVISPVETPTMGSRLLPNVPNPFNPTTRVNFELDRAQPVQLIIFDLAGRQVRTLVDDNLGAGPHHRVWNGRDDSGRQVSSGAYYARLVTESGMDHHKMMLLK